MLLQAQLYHIMSSDPTYVRVVRFSVGTTLCNLDCLGSPVDSLNVSAPCWCTNKPITSHQTKLHHRVIIVIKGEISSVDSELCLFGRKKIRL